jgi:molybdate transport system substrate-binding protein
MTDVAILTKSRAEKLVRAAKLVGGTTTVLARVAVGLAVEKGARHPDISSVEAVKRTLLNAKSIAYVDPASGGTSGIFLARALNKLGIATELKLKIRLVSPPAGQSSPRVGELVQRGEAEIGIQPISELLEVSGIEIVGPLPADLQIPALVYVAGSPNLSRQPLQAKALVDFLASPVAGSGLQGKWNGTGITDRLENIFSPAGRRIQSGIAPELGPEIAHRFRL